MTVGISAPPIGITRQMPKRQAEQDEERKQHVRQRTIRQPKRDEHRGSEQRKVDGVLIRQTFDRAGNQLLQLAERDEAAREREAAEQDFHRQDGHREVVDCALAVEPDSSGPCRPAPRRAPNACESAVRCGHGGHRHPDRHRRTDERAEDHAD